MFITKCVYLVYIVYAYIRRAITIIFLISFFRFFQNIQQTLNFFNNKGDKKKKEIIPKCLTYINNWIPLGIALNIMPLEQAILALLVLKFMTFFLVCEYN